MILHIVRIAGLITLLVLSTFYPFLPGKYDTLAIPLSGMAQIFGIVGLLLIPVFYVVVRRLLGDKLDEAPKLPRDDAAG